ncbi:MAG: hypothetical protein C4K60_14410 [Ideonella sp. MAG2]|nr:MAG: hypothetical protein C4K60_14410 [Ideonella sp. MAG2]
MYYEQYYAPNRTMKTFYWGKDELCRACVPEIQAIFFIADSSETVQDFADWMNFNSDLGNFSKLIMISIPIDIIDKIDWAGIGSGLRHLHISHPVFEDIWSMYSESRLPIFPTRSLQNLETLNIICPLVKWVSLDVSQLKSLKWFGLELEGMDKNGKSIEMVCRNSGIVGIDISTPKGQDFLGKISADMESIAIHMWTAKKVDFAEFSRFYKLRHLILRGGGCVVDLGFLKDLEELEELEILSYPEVVGLENLSHLKKLRRLRIGFLDKELASESHSILSEVKNRVEIFEVD